jgi:ATP-dependent helicase/nuclease subunit A
MSESTTEEPEKLTPNDRQQELIDSTEGIYLVDAGPGTGKTFAVTRRYASIVDQPDVEPNDVLLVTFTRSAATEMKERIVDHSGYSMRELADAPIQTFHSHCHDILREHGYAAPTHLGLDERITGSTQVVEDELVETKLFREFFSQFRDSHPEYADFYRILSSPTELLDLVKELASKGVFPTADGWYRDGEEVLDGDFDAFKECFNDVNQPRNGGSKQAKLRSKLGRFGKNKTYLPVAPSKNELRGGRGTKQLDDSVARDVFEEDREDLTSFVHDVYFEYLDFALGRNYLNFGFLQLFAFVLLCENPTLREKARFEYVMVDEFQDTSEIQFKLALLLADTDNFCAVGDWKQSIYSFQYADVDNIIEFETRLNAFSADLNSDAKRVSFDSDVERIPLEENYRSTQTIIDFSEEGLVTPANNNDDVDASTLEDVVELSSNAPFDNTTLAGYQHEDDHEAVLSLVQDIVGNDDYEVRDEDGEPRPPDYEDIAVFTRTRDYGRELMTVADDYDFPIAYDGGVELFRTDPAKLLLAWLRILDDGSNRGWAVVLEKAGYTLDEVDAILETESYPDNMAEFQATLHEMESVGAVARRVFDRYGCDGDYADVILHTIQAIHDSTTLTRGDLIQFIERGIETGATHEVHTSADENSVTVQTIHAAKGLEYPIVIMANMNEGRFPPSSRDSSVIQYKEPIGLRQRKKYAEVHEHPHIYDNWNHDVLRHCLPTEYDEERRLLYVAITRAENHAFFVGGEDPNTFFEELPLTVEEIDPDVTVVDEMSSEQANFPFAVTATDGPSGHTPHSLMDDSVFEDADEEMEHSTETEAESRGINFGSRVHDFAEAYALGEAVEPSSDHEERVKRFIDGLSGELHVEETVALPLDVDRERVTVSGIVDLVQVTEEGVKIIDYKTDSSRRAESEYRKQLSVYYHVLSEWFDDLPVTTAIFYTNEDALVQVEPLSLEEIRDLVRHRSQAD